jgi:N-acyl-D-amino-acid deacylase
MTAMPAAKVGLNDRGVIKKGMCADLVVFDFDAIRDTHAYEKPNTPCEGIARVYVNGVLTAQDGGHTGAKGGQLLRRTR